MKRLTKRKGSHVYLINTANICFNNKPISERIFCSNCNEKSYLQKGGRDKCGPLVLIDKLAAYEDLGYEPEELEFIIEDHLRMLNEEYEKMSDKQVTNETL